MVGVIRSHIRGHGEGEKNVGITVGRDLADSTRHPLSAALGGGTEGIWGLKWVLAGELLAQTKGGAGGGGGSEEEAGGRFAGILRTFKNQGNDGGRGVRGCMGGKGGGTCRE